MKRLMAILLFSFPIVSVHALELQADRSHLYFVSVKNDAFAEVMTFDQLSGQISSQGEAQIVIPLDSVNSGIEIRDERMRQFLFKTKEFSKAVYTAKLDVSALSSMETGQQKAMSLSGELALNGKLAKVDFDILVSKNKDGSFTATTVAPGFVDIKRFDLVSGVGKLRSLAGLNSITLVVPVTFSVVFQ